MQYLHCSGGNRACHAFCTVVISASFGSVIKLTKQEECYSIHNLVYFLVSLDKVTKTCIYIQVYLFLFSKHFLTTCSSTPVTTFIPHQLLTPMATCWALLSFGIDHTRNFEFPGGPSRSEFILKTCEHQLCLPSRNHTSVLYFTDCVHAVLFNHYNKYSIIVYAYTCSIWSKLIHCTGKDTRFLISIYREMEAK